MNLETAVATASPASARGYVLLEALVAIFLFVVGVLGVLGLQAGTTRAQTENRIRSEAAYLAQELVGLMWADAAQLNEFQISSGDCSAAACKRWLEKVKTGLPQGSAEINVAGIADGSIGGDVDIVLHWTMPDAAAHRYTTSTTIAASHTP